ncbi:MAG TPA: alpha/beta hydrolase [Chitinophagaceae bacterium]|jgi:pimeloyl-ACP methyl ester carboxylesterase
MQKLLSFIYSCVFLLACSSSPSEKKEIKNGDVKIACNISGNSDTSVVFVHGWCINKEYWQKQEDYLKGRFKVIALDLGGHGESGHNRTTWTIDDFAGDVISVINELDLSKVILIGHSMGGDIVLRVTDSVPDKIIGFIGIDNFKDEIATQYTQEQQKQIDSFFIQLETNFDTVATGYSRAALFPPNYADTVSVNRVIKDIQSSDSLMACAALRSLMHFAPREPAMLSRLKIPFHLIVSDYTPTNEEAIKKYLTTPYSVKTIHGTGHYPMIEKPDEFNELLKETLDEISKGK